MGKANSKGYRTTQDGESHCCSGWGRGPEEDPVWKRHLLNWVWLSPTGWQRSSLGWHRPELAPEQAGSYETHEDSPPGELAGHAGKPRAGCWWNVLGNCPLGRLRDFLEAGWVPVEPTEKLLTRCHAVHRGSAQPGVLQVAEHRQSTGRGKHSRNRKRSRDLSPAVSLPAMGLYWQKLTSTSWLQRNPQGRMKRHPSASL